MTYTYPDKNDKMTGELISRVSTGDYWKESEDEVLKMCFNRMKEVSWHLDLGCGQGRLIEPFLEYSSSVVGAEPDISRYMYSMEEAKRLSDLFPEKNITVIKGDINSVIESGFVSFDTVLSSHVIQHIPFSMTYDMMKKMSSLIKEGGYLFMTSTYNDSDCDIFTLEIFDDKGKREVKYVTEEDCAEAFGKENILPVAFYTKKRIISMMNSFGMVLDAIRGYHFYYDDHNVRIEDDERLNGANDLSHARDVLYIFRKSGSR